MAIYHLSAKVISRGTGRSSTAAAAYRAGQAIADERTGELHDYTRKQGVLDHAVLAPSRAPEWARESATLWNAVEQFEKRKDSQVCREVIVALPNELTLEQNRDMLHGYVKEAFISRGMAAQVDIHAPHRDGDKRNIHAHILLTTRQITRNGFKAKKARNWNEKATLVEWREQWAAHMNRALERAQKTGRVDARSFKDQGIDGRAPSSHLGPAASQMERRGQNTRIGEENRAAAVFNELQRKAKVIDLARERAKRRQVIAQRAEEAIERGLKRLSTEYSEAADNKTADRWRLQMAQQERKAVNDRKDDRPIEAQDNRRRALLQDRHITERSDIGRRDDVQRQKLTAQQRQQYGKDLLENRRRLAEIAQRQKQTGLKAALYRMTRRAKTDRITAETCRKNIENIRWRIAEQRNALKTVQGERQQTLENQQQRDVRKLESQISKAAKEREIESAHRSKVRAEKDQVIRADIRERNRPRWAALYRAQEAERRELEQALSAGGKRLQNWLKHNELDPFSARAGHLSDGFQRPSNAPMKALEARHEAQRDALADDVRAQAREAAQAERKRAKQQQRPQRGKQAAKTSKERPAPPRTERPEPERDQPAKSAGNDNDAQRRMAERIKARREQRQHERERDNGRER